MKHSIKHLTAFALMLFFTTTLIHLTYAAPVYVEGAWVIQFSDEDSDHPAPATAFIGVGNATGSILPANGPVIPLVIEPETVLQDRVTTELAAVTPTVVGMTAPVDPPLNLPIAEGTIQTERGTFRVASSFMAHATAYSPEQTDLSPFTASGLRFVTGIVAVDPTVIPLGTYIYVPGFGLFLAADTGGAIHGNRIDISFDTIREALQFGRRDVPVYVLEKFTDLF